MQILTYISWLFLALSLAGVAYELIAAWAVGRYARADSGSKKSQPAPARGPALPVTVLKPLHGAEPHLFETLETFFHQDYPAEVQILFGVQDPADPAIGVVHALAKKYPKADAQLIINPAMHGLNAKISNLMNLEGDIRHPLVVISDSDIAVAPDYLSRIAAAISEPDVGVVTSLYRGFAATKTLAAKISAMGVSYHFLPNVVMGLTLKMAEPCMGSTIALSHRTLEQIGGFAAFAGYLADDYEIGRAVRALGKKVAIPAFAVGHGAAEPRLKDWFSHELRWMRTIRVNDPAGHFGSIVTHPLPLACISVLLSGFTLVSLWSLAATLIARFVLKWQLDRCFGAGGGPFWLLPARDLLAFGVFFASLFGGPVEWRGKKLHVTAGGVLSKKR